LDVTSSSVNALSVSTWNNLPGSVNFSSLIRTVELANLSDYWRCFSF